jgi:cbb3-type cytochrome oxidase maturation protein
MSALMFLIPLSILIVTIGTGILLWAIRNGQYRDLSNRMPDDDEPK